MIELDGSMGEGGGQVLRSALTMSILTSQAFTIQNIRAQRQKPGLMAQHLKAVDAAAAVSRAAVDGARLGSSHLEFYPGEIRAGRYQFDIGTAGATSLVLQTIAIPLSFAGSASSVIITGGTHVPWSPCFHYLDLQWRYWLERIGFNLDLTLDLAGFYPQGGGRISCVIRPANPLVGLQLAHRRGIRPPFRHLRSRRSGTSHCRPPETPGFRTPGEALPYLPGKNHQASGTL